MKHFFSHLAILCTLLGIGISAPTAQAQTMSKNITNIGVGEGLSNSFILWSVEDVHGAIWFLTEAGINRIAADGCISFTTDNSDLPENGARTIYYHRPSDQIWLLTFSSGLVAIDCKTLQISQQVFGESINTQSMSYAADAADGGLWVGYADGCICHYSPDGKSTLYNHIDIPELPTNQIRFMLDDGLNHLYVGYNNNGMVELDINMHRAKHFLHNVDNATSLPGNNVRVMALDAYHNLWVGTNGGLALFDSFLGQFTLCSKANGFVEDTSGNNIMGLCSMRDGTLWCSSEPGGISILDLNNFSKNNLESVTISKLLPYNSRLSSPHTRTIIQDQYDNIWICHYGTGVDVIESLQSPFHILNEPGFDKSSSRTLSSPLRFAYGIDVDSQQNLWIGGSNTLFRCRDNQIVEQLDITPYIGRPFGKTYLTYCDSHDRVWLGVDDVGVVCYDSKCHRFFRVPLFEDFLDVHSFLEDSQGRMWIGTEKGVCLYDGMRGVLQPQIIPNGANQVIFALQEDVLGRIWVGTFGSGIYIYDPISQKSMHLGTAEGLSNDNINQIYRDVDDAFWIATRKGLTYISQPGSCSEVQVYGKQEGLADSHIRSVLQDQMGQIWISTNTTISYWNQRTHRFSNYDFHNGLPNGGFVEGSSVKAADGTLYFVSSNGICYFQPRFVTNHEEVSQVQISRVTESENYYRIDFSVSNYAQRNLVEYAYRLEGVDNDWHTTLGDTKVVFRNLPAGHYNFQVRACLRNSDWSDFSMAETKFVIDPPLWLTWWAISLYFLVGIAITALIIYYYLHKVKLETFLKAEEKRREDEHNLNEERLRFYTNITHELRTPLTLILGPLEDLENDKQLADRYRHSIKTIHSSAERLLNLINQLLEFRKTESQNRKLVVAKGDLRQVVREVGLRYKELLRNPQVTVRISVPEQFPALYFDAEVIRTVLNNLLSNAIKYTVQGEITLILEQQEQDGERLAVIRVKDTGYGISAEALPRIFDRYYQADGKHQASGSGIGLALVRSLAMLHQGTVKAESQVGQGSCFSFSISMDNNYPDVLHKEAEDVQQLSSLGETTVETSGAQEIDSRPILLVVEDNDDIRQYILESFDLDYQVITTANGRQGLETAFQQIPDIVISDIMMPEMDGIELCRLLKGDVRTSHIPVVLLTAKDTIEDKEVGYDSGADSYLTKPFSAKLLKSRLQNLLTSRRRLSETLLQQGPSKPATAPSADTPVVQEEIAHISPIDVEFIDHLNAVIAENLSSEQLDIAMLIDKLNMSNSTLYRKVKALTGMSANEYIRYRRLLKAKEMLQTGKHNVSETAYETGFSTPNYFRDCFKAAFGMSPSEFQKQG